ncbi:LOW QUALITY PROTEIN: Polyprotein [Phytophthora palmivora]|uniref:Polyprotein n=1 Tax=Phytophthora palmivora TaxID=4796 RepID=A0A2P4YG22_9STRA|nr:LOW QUALITY PROTEIN: Polyprotein [Phytophthora palmivora]
MWSVYVQCVKYCDVDSCILICRRKTEAIAKYPTPTKRKALLSFMGLAGFIVDSFTISLNLLPEEEGYLHLKLSLQQAPTLKLPDFERPFIVTTDASGHCIDGALSQKYDGADDPIAFYSKKMDRGWPTHGKELLVIKVATEKWRHYLHGRHFDVSIDNSVCSRMLHHTRVSPKMSRFLTHFSQLEFTSHHIKGKANVVPDGLSRPLRDDKDEEEDKEPHLPDVTNTQVNTVDYHFVSPHLAIETKREFQRGYANDPGFKQQWSKGTEEKKLVKYIGLLYFRQKKGETVYRLCVLKSKKLRTDVIMECHDGATSAHTGGRCTYLKAAQWFYWPTMDTNIKDQKKKGLLMPIPTPREYWEVLSMDFITGLPASEGYDAIFVIVDKLFKRPKYAPTYSTSDAKDTANGFFDVVVRHHGLPKKFLSDFWKSLVKLCWKMHLDVWCRITVDDWMKHLGTIEFAHSTLVNASTKMTPFKVDVGRKVSNLLTERMKELVYSESDGILEEFAKNVARERQEVVEQAQEKLKHAQERQKEYYDRKRRQVVFKKATWYYSIRRTYR